MVVRLLALRTNRLYPQDILLVLILRPYFNDSQLASQIIRFKLCNPQGSAVYYCNGKGKSVPLQAWTGPEGSRKLRFPDFVTTAQDVGKVVSLTHRPPLPPGNTPGTHFC